MSFMEIGCFKATIMNSTMNVTYTVELSMFGFFFRLNTKGFRKESEWIKN